MTRTLSRILRLPAIRAAIERAAFQAASDIAARVSHTRRQAERRKALSARIRSVINADRRRRVVAAALERRPLIRHD